MPQIKAAVIDRFRTRGGDLDRWSLTDGQTMADALSYGEDTLEIVSRGKMRREREALREIRRRLEQSVLN
jgi:hypothetical protein